MSVFVDVQTIDGGVSAADVAGANTKDLETQQKCGVSYLRCNEDREAHTLVEDDIFGVCEHS